MTSAGKTPSKTMGPQNGENQSFFSLSFVLLIGVILKEKQGMYWWEIVLIEMSEATVTFKPTTQERF